MTDREFTRRLLQTVATVAATAILLAVLWAAREALLASPLERPLPLVVKRDSERLALTLESPGIMQ